MIKTYVDQKAVITGAARGIGKTLALGMAKRGADVIVVDIHGDEVEETCKQIKEMGRESYALQADVSLSSECDKIFAFTMEKFGRCDILVNNAGVSMKEDVWDFRDDDLHWIFETNVYSHWYMLRNFIPQMRKQGNHCQILNVCSIAGLVTSGPGPAYFSSKHAAIALAESTYKQLKAAGDDIDISVFAPGFIQTELYKSDENRPPRYAIDPDDPYYKSEKYQKFYAFNKYLLDNGLPLQETIEKVFDMLSRETFYILTHDQYDPMLRAQGNAIADKTSPLMEKIAVTNDA
jgi:NAD(P)-dependent dehydrogenase (short-subunit alcohol dehydrogenase family)